MKQMKVTRELERGQIAMVDFGEFKRDCTLMTEQLFTVDKESILSTVGRVSEGIMSQINEALKVSLAL